MDWIAEHWLDVVGWGGSALLVASLLQKRVLRFRALNLVACSVLVVFNALVGVWPMAAMNLVLAAINVWFLVRLSRERHDQAAFEVVEVAPDDQFLAHVLRTHGADVARFQPDFGAPTSDDEAFVVVRGDETVGVVVLRPEGETAHVRLDYVTPRYRDFTPGEFVWRHSRLLRDRGYRRVLTPSGMVAPYYDRLGFTRAGEAYALEL